MPAKVEESSLCIEKRDRRVLLEHPDSRSELSGE
jgi:hypothetical protein